MERFHLAAQDKLGPFILVIEGLDSRRNQQRGRVLGVIRHRSATGQPITTCEWIDRLAPKAWAVIAAGTCATYGGIHAMEGNPTGCMGLADYLGWEWRSKADIPIVCVPGCPVQPDNFMETLLYLLHMAAGRAPMIPLDEALAPHLAISAARCMKDAIAADTTSRRNLPRNTDRRYASSSSAAGDRWCSAM